jgi:hypothetical protein
MITGEMTELIDGFPNWYVAYRLEASKTNRHGGAIAWRHVFRASRRMFTSSCGFQAKVTAGPNLFRLAAEKHSKCGERVRTVVKPAASKAADGIGRNDSEDMWRARRDSNSRPDAPEASALSS